MNLAEALNAALPELPARTAKIGFPKPDPHLIWHENIDEGQQVIVAFVPGGDNFYRFTPAQWDIVQMFDGERSYAEIAEILTAQSGVEWTENEVREFAAPLENFWYKSPIEKNIALTQKLSDARSKRIKKKSRWGDLSSVTFNAFDPDKFLTALHKRIGFVFTPWFTFLTLCLFTFMIYVFIDRWGEIGRDTLQYYTFTEKGLTDLAEFWVLFLIMGFIHESAHGLLCKHYGGAVHRMGFMLLYLAPAFFADITESFIYASRWERARVVLAGVWSEMICCGLATIVWWGTAAGSYAHELAYKIMLVTGVAVVVVNMNPLIRLDGYFLFSEIIGFSDLKEKSTAFLSGLVKKYVWGLPVEIEYVPVKRRWLYIPYALLSGAYSYLMLYAVVRFVRNIASHYTPDWAFVPALFIAWLIFRSRLRTLGKFMNTVYLDKKERLKEWMRGPRLVAVTAVAIVVVVTPLFRETVSGRVVLESSKRALVRAEVPGVVDQVFVSEGQSVQAGTPLLRMHDVDLESDLAKAQADYRVAEAAATNAQLKYVGFGSADKARQEARAKLQLVQSKAAKLLPVAPITGVIMTPRVGDLVGRKTAEGTFMAEVADTRVMRARIYLPESEVSFVHPDAEVHISLDSSIGTVDSKVAVLNPASTPIPDGLMKQENYKGLGAPDYYVAEAFLTNDGTIREGMTGTAKILVRRESIAQIVWRNVSEFAGRKIW